MYPLSNHRSLAFVLSITKFSCSWFYLQRFSRESVDLFLSMYTVDFDNKIIMTINHSVFLNYVKTFLSILPSHHRLVKYSRVCTLPYIHSAIFYCHIFVKTPVLLLHTYFFIRNCIYPSAADFLKLFKVGMCDSHCSLFKFLLFYICFPHNKQLRLNDLMVRSIAFYIADYMLYHCIVNGIFSNY